MIRLCITVEGYTEQGFVKDVLAEHLADFGVNACARPVITGRDKRASREFRGGMTTYSRARDDVLSWIKEDRRREWRFTTMFDLYALPDDFPGYTEARRLTDPYQRVRAVEGAMSADLAAYPSFFPYIQLHEFESLILADPQKLGPEYPDREGEIAQLIALARDENPECINGGQDTAPSKRIKKLIPEYDKVTAGKLIAKGIGIKTLRERCRHFNEWLSRLERLKDETS